MKLKWTLALLMGAVLTACSLFRGNTVRVTDKNFDEEVDIVQNLVFTFNHPLAPENAIDDWDSTRYIAFEPAIPGSFKWISDRELVFSPAVGLKPSTNYKAKLQNRLGALGDAKRAVDEEAISFHTPYLKVEKIEPYWGRGERGQVEARARLIFNYSVKPADLQALVSIVSDNKNVGFTPVTQEPNKEIIISMPDVDSKTKSAIDFTILIKQGLRCVNGETPTLKPIEVTASLSLAGNLTVYEVNSTHDGNEGIITVRLNKMLLEENLSSFIEIKGGNYWDETKYDVFTTTISENQLEIRSALTGTETYRLILKKGLEGVDGGKLESDSEHKIDFVDEFKNISFASKRGLYLSGKGERMVEINIANVENVTVKVAKIYENNIQQFFRNGSSYEYSYNEDWGGNEYEYYNIDAYGDTLFTQQLTAANLRKHNGKHVLKLDFEDRRKNYKGIYVVEVASKDELWIRANKVIAITDVGLMVKEGVNSLMVVANSIQDTKPLKGAKINMISSNNQHVLTATTDGEGVAMFENLKTGLDGFKLSMLTASYEDDFNYLLFNQSRIETSRFEVGGKSTLNRDYDAYIYGEREVYRPGETVNINALVRSFDWQPVADMPVTLKVMDPNGREFTAQRGALNKEGAFQASVEVPTTAPTGSYSFELYTGANQLLHSRSVLIEEFMPDRIKVDIALDKTTMNAGQSLKSKVTARNFFGPPAANRTYETTFSLKKDFFNPKGFDEYEFDVVDETALTSVSREGVTDANGQFEQTFDLPESYRNIGVLKGTVLATVFDESARPVSRVKSVQVFTQPYYLGIKRFDAYVSTDAPLQIPIAAVNTSGLPINGVQGVIKIIKNNWETVVERQYGSFRYTSKKSEQIMSVKTLTVNGASGFYTYLPRESGQYEARLYMPGSEKYVSREFYAFGWGSTSNNSFEVNNDGQIDIVGDKTEYKTGDKAKILFKTPFDGKLIVTLERDRVYKRFYLNTENKAASLEVNLNAECLPNVYVSATLLRPMDGSPIPFTVAHGFQSLKVDDPANKVDVQIIAAKTSRSRQKQTVTIRTKPNAELTVAVVDQGILFLKDTQTPDPYKYFYANRALEVNNYDIYPLLLPEISRRNQAGSSSTGGDMAMLEKLGARQNPIANKRVKLMSKWSGQLKANSSGVATFSYDIHQFSGEVRIMAVAYKGKTFGSSEATMTVADPIVLSTALPRFLSPGDTAFVPVTLTNTTKQTANATANLAVTGPLKVVGAASQTAGIAANGEKRLTFKVLALQQIGEASVEVKVNALNETFRELVELPVRPASPLQKITGSGAVEGGLAQTITPGVSDFIAQSVQGRLLVSRSPMVEFSKDLSYLIEYPHGCLEQTVSTAFPQIYFTDLTKSLRLKKGKQGGNPAANVQAAIQKLEGMQQYSGGFSYWAGADNYVNWWGSVFATHFLIEAKSAGFQVSAKTVQNAQKFLLSKLNQRELTNYYNEDGSYGKYLNKEIAYSVFVLTLGGNKQMAVLNYLKANANQLAPDSKYLVAASFGLLGDQTAFNGLLPVALDGKNKRETGGSFSSPIRDKALALYTLLTVKPNHPQAGVLSRQVSQALKNGSPWYYSTQERIFSLLALGKMASQTKNSTVTANILVDGKVVGAFDGKDLAIDKGVAGKNVVLQTAGAGKLYYYWETQGISLSGQNLQPENFLTINRSYYDRNGKPISGTVFTQNDLVVVKLAVKCKADETVENVAITDLLPAGFEIENPRVTNLPELNWIKDQAAAQYMDVRDDRIHFFDQATGATRYYYYAVRAVSPGQFQTGSASADAMYQSEYHAYTPSGRITVRALAEKIAQ